MASVEKSIILGKMESKRKKRTTKAKLTDLLTAAMGALVEDMKQ